MEVTWDKSVKIGYIRLHSAPPAGIAAESIELDE
jgi:hypothetical protein